MFPFDARVKSQVALIDAGTWEMRLFTAPASIDNTTIFVDFTEPTFPGYAPIAVAWEAPALDGDNNSLTTLDDPITFEQTSPAAAQIVLGAFLTLDLGGGDVVAYDFKLFPAPLVFSTTGNLVTIADWLWRMGPIAP